MAEQQLFPAKIRFCNTHPFTGLAALGMWYGFIVKSEIPKWEAASRSAALGKANDAAALCFNQGYHVRRVLTDGKLLQVYDRISAELLEASLLPASLLGNNLTLIPLNDIPTVFAAKGGYRAEVTIDGIPRRGWFLPGKLYNAFWSEEGKPYHSENPGAPKPNTDPAEIRRL